MSKIIRKLEDLNGLEIRKEYYYDLDYYKCIEQIRVSDGKETIEIYNIKIENEPVPYPTYTLPQIVEQLRDRYGFDIIYQELIILSLKEIEVLKALKVLGYNWIARDKDGELYGYLNEPSLGYEYCYYGLKMVSLNQELFQFITFETGAYEIPNLD